MVAATRHPFQQEFAVGLAAAAKMLHDVGISLLVDLIVLLPGDTPDDVAQGVDFLLEHGLGMRPIGIPPHAARDGLNRAKSPDDSCEVQ
jgi:radical SAM superfamily enzyme YgiQ (UPF0313 family)